MGLTIPETFDDLVEQWHARGIDFQRRLVQLLLEPIVVHPAGERRRLFDPGRIDINPRA